MNDEIVLSGLGNGMAIMVTIGDSSLPSHLIATEMSNC